MVVRRVSKVKVGPNPSNGSFVSWLGGWTTDGIWDLTPNTLTAFEHSGSRWLDAVAELSCISFCVVECNLVSIRYGELLSGGGIWPHGCFLRHAITTRGDNGTETG